MKRPVRAWKVAAGLIPVAAILTSGPLCYAETAGVPAEAMAQSFAVRESEIDDLKAVYATVRSTDRVEARVRISGTIASLSVDEGVGVNTGDVLGIVADQKLALRLKSLEAQIAGLSAQLENAGRELGRAEELIKRGVTPKARVDELRTALEVTSNQLKSAEAERGVVLRQVEEGQVLAPAQGRVLQVPVTVGSVVMPGESIATIAANQYVLRLELPERQARAMKVGDPVLISARGADAGRHGDHKGRIVTVYPELSSGRVIADAEADGLDRYFVGERVLTWISAGKRHSIAVPAGYVFRRFGNDWARLTRNGGPPVDVVVQTGRPARLPEGGAGVEVLSGLKPGDELLHP